jgi:predicted transposase/invertase (TIGR01784 family)
MVKFRRYNKKDIVNNVLHRWLAFLDKNTSIETIKKILEMDPAIRKAHEKIMVVTQNDAELHAYRMREMAIYDYNSGINAAEKRGRDIGIEEGIVIGKEEGRAIGKEEGREEGKTLFVVYLKRNGHSVEAIANQTMLTEEKVKKILKEQGLDD